MFLELLAFLLLGSAAAAIVYVAVISTNAVAEQVREWWGARTTVVVIDPASSAELSRIAAEHGSKRHKRFVYNRARNETQLVESDSIAADFANKAQVELYVA